MASQLKNSKTKENLMKAFAGESQARNRYTFAAEEARKEGLYAVSQIFLFTAEQERAHAERFYELLKEMAGETIEICGGSCIEDVTTHLMNHLSLHPTLRTCSSDTILRAIKDFMKNMIHSYKVPHCFMMNSET